MEVLNWHLSDYAAYQAHKMRSWCPISTTVRTIRKVLASLLIVTAAVVFLGCYALFVRSQAASLLLHLTALSVSTSTESDADQLTRKFVRYLVSRESDSDGVTTTTFSVHNRWLSALRLEPDAFFRASVGVKNGRVCHIGAMLFRSMDTYPTFQGSAGMVDEYAEYPRQHSGRQNYEFLTPVGKPYLKVLVDSRASPVQRRHAFAFSFRCLIKPGGGCDIPCDYLPEAWQDWRTDLRNRGFALVLEQYYPKSARCDSRRAPTPD
jgi:hypothetical protein